MAVKPFSKALKIPLFTHALSQSPACHHLTRPLSAASLQTRRERGGEEGGDPLDLNLPSSEFQRDDMQPQW